MRLYCIHIQFDRQASVRCMNESTDSHSPEVVSITKVDQFGSYFCVTVIFMHESTEPLCFSQADVCIHTTPPTDAS